MLVFGLVSLSFCHFCLFIMMHPHFCCSLWVLCDVFWSHSLSALPNFILSDQQNCLYPSWFSLKPNKSNLYSPYILGCIAFTRSNILKENWLSSQKLKGGSCACCLNSHEFMCVTVLLAQKTLCPCLQQPLTPTVSPSLHLLPWSLCLWRRRKYDIGVWCRAEPFTVSSYVASVSAPEFLLKIRKVAQRAVSLICFRGWEDTERVDTLVSDTKLKVLPTDSAMKKTIWVIMTYKNEGWGDSSQ